MTTFNPISMNKQQMHLPYQSSISNPMLITDKVSIKPTIHTPQTSNTMNTNPTITNIGCSSNSIMNIGSSSGVSTTSQEESIYSKYTFHNAKEFRDKFKVNNNVLETIWNANFKKKNGFCPNCNIFGICKPINNKALNNPRKFPFGLIVSIVETPSKPEDFTFICYMCYNEHMRIPGCLSGATAPMDTNDDTHNMNDEYMDIFSKYNKKISTTSK